MPKLPTIASGSVGVKPIPLADVSAPGRALAVRQEAITQVTKAASKLVNDAYVSHQNFLSEKATNDVATNMREVEKNIQSKDFFSPDEIPEGIDVRREEEIVDKDGNITTIPRDKIPSYEVAPSMYKQQYDANITAGAANITSPKWREAWKSQAEKMASTAIHKISIRAIDAQKKELRTMYVNNIQDALDKGNYDVAIGLASSDVFSDSETTGLKGDVRNRQEKDLYDESISTDNINDMSAHLDTLQDEEYNQDLNQSERLIYVNKLKSALAATKDNTDQIWQTEQKRLKRDIDRTVKGMENGEIMDAQALSDLMARTDAGFALSPSTMVLHNDKLKEAIRMMPEVMSMSRMSNLEREKHMKSVKAEAKDPASAYRANVLANVDQNMSTRIADDVLSLGADVGLVSLTRMPDPNDPPEFIKWLSLRQRGYDTLLNKYSEGAYLTKDETTMISNTLETMTNDQRLYLMGLVSEGLGSEAPLFWEELNTKRDGIYSVAGSVFAQGDRDVARSILKGKDFIMSGNYVKPAAIDVAMAQSEGIAGAYALDSQRAAILDSVNAVYADLSKAAGEFDATIFDTDRYEDAIEMVTGGLMSIGGNLVAPPIRGMDEDTFDSYVRDVSTPWFEEQGGVGGYSNKYEEFRDDIRSGQLKLMGIGQNEYLIYSDIVDSYLLNEKTKEPFLFFYDPTATMVERGFFGGVKEERPDE